MDMSCMFGVIMAVVALILFGAFLGWLFSGQSATIGETDTGDLPSADGEPRTVEDGQRYVLRIPAGSVGSGSPAEIAAAVWSVAHEGGRKGGARHE